MKLFSTLNEIAVDARARTGRVGGDLRLFFTVLNQADILVPTRNLFEWNGDGPVNDTYTLMTGEIISLNLLVDTEGIAGTLFIFGTINVTIPDSAGFRIHPMGESTIPFLPGNANHSTQMSTSTADAAGKRLDTGFELEVPWDGTSADCHGKWWAKWK